MGGGGNTGIATQQAYNPGNDFHQVMPSPSQLGYIPQGAISYAPPNISLGGMQLPPVTAPVNRAALSQSDANQQLVSMLRQTPLGGIINRFITR